MPRENMSAKTGDAPVVRQGHTTSGKHGSDPNAKGKGQTKVRDLKIK